jgi:PAS domain S-box-containing protein
MTKVNDHPKNFIAMRKRAALHLNDRLSNIRNRCSSQSELQDITRMLAFHRAELNMQCKAFFQSDREPEDGLQNQIERYDYAPMVYLSLNRDGTVVQVNLTGSKLLEQIGCELNECSFACCIAERDRPVFKDFLENLFSSSQSDFCEVTCVNHGQEIPVHIAGSASDNGEHCTLIVQELTGENLLKKPLQEHDSLYRFISENTGDVIWLYDFKSEKYLYVSPSVFRQKGFTPEEVLQHTLFDAYTPASRAAAESEIARRLMLLRSGDESARFALSEFDQLRKDGSVAPTEVMTTFIHDEEGRLTGIIGVDRDISERRRIELEKDELQQQLLHSRKMESVARIAGGIGHDFNNKLQAILGNTDLLIASGKLDSQTIESLLDIRHAVLHCAGLTNQLLSFARKRVIVPQVLNVNAELSQAIQSAHYRTEKNIIIDFTPDSSLWPVKMDPSQLNEIMEHLIKNAFDAMDDGGVVTIKTRNVAMKGEMNDIDPGITLLDAVLLEVVDTGHGIEKEVLEHIFEPFFTTKMNSSGLGLSTVYGIVEQNKGFISTESIPGSGTSFRVFLPRYEGLSTKGSKSTDIAGCPGGTETILLVDDEASIRKITSKFLEGFGYKVLQAENADDAQRKAAAFPGTIHMLLTDMIMPGMNGKELSDLMKPQYQDLKILFMSGYSNDILNSDRMSYEDIQFLGKPFSRTTLALKVREVLDAGKAQLHESGN